MGNKSICGKTNQAAAYTDSYQSTSVSSQLSTANNNALKRSFVQGQMTKDNFKILKVIGRGSFGKVFLVEKKKNSTIEINGGAKMSFVGIGPQYYAMKVLKKGNLLERN